MLFVPYAVDLHLAKIPWLTIGVSILCLGIYVEQSNSADAFSRETESFCAEPQPRMFEIGVQQITGSIGVDACQDVLWDLYFSPSPEMRIEELLADTSALAGLDREGTHEYLTCPNQDLI
jgi:hypothetical protein